MQRSMVIASALLAAVTASDAMAQERLQVLHEDASRRQLFGILLNREGLGAEALPYRFRFPDDLRSNSQFGIDISHHNEDGCRCTIDWSRVAANGAQFAFIKASQGGRSVDPRFSASWARAGQHEIARGAYHFLTSDDPVDQQVQAFLKTLHAAGGLRPSDMPPSLDLEWHVRVRNGSVVKSGNRERDFWDTVPPEQILQQAEEWLTKVEQAVGRTPLLYTSTVWWNERIGNPAAFSRFAHYPIWIADYSANGRGQEKPRVPGSATWHLWQFSDTAYMERIGQPGARRMATDISIFNGSFEDFRTAFGLR